ncbi:amidase [Saliniradius amylolyticus]|uniref:amidase n=1 Tax=Saliniradius amylolyticus TaxID=2183582 RepID=UPI0013A562B7|nr:amidase [Saliniradius amylolyticus]
MNYLSATELVELYRRKEASPVEVMTDYIQQYNKVNPSLNAFSFTFFEQALAKASKAEQAYASGQAGALEGLAIAIKDETYIEGQETTNGSRLLQGDVATSTDPVAERLIAAGGIVHGRTTTPEFSTAAVTWSDLWGVSRSPWNPEVTCGGSSGGSAIAVASGMTAFANGTDIGGSVRIPAAFCGLYGYKPAHGWVPEIAPYNIDPYCHHGLLARTLDDIQLGYQVIRGPHQGDLHSFVPRPQEADIVSLKDVKVGVSEDLGFYSVEQDVRRCLRQAVGELTQAGVVATDITLDWDEQVIETAKVHQRANMGLYLAQRWNRPENRAHMTSYLRQYLDNAEAVTAKKILEANLYLCHMWQSLSQVFAQHDVLICPTLCTTQVPADFDYSRHQIEVDGQIVDPNKGWFMTYPFNTLGQCPVLTMPVGECDNGIPGSVQIVGRPYQEQAVFAVARQLSRTLSADFYHTRFPAFDSITRAAV